MEQLRSLRGFLHIIQILLELDLLCDRCTVLTAAAAAAAVDISRCRFAPVTLRGRSHWTSASTLGTFIWWTQAETFHSFWEGDDFLHIQEVVKVNFHPFVSWICGGFEQGGRKLFKTRSREGISDISGVDCWADSPKHLSCWWLTNKLRTSTERNPLIKHIFKGLECVCIR